MIIYVAFKDDTEEVIANWYCCQQPVGIPFYAEIQASDQRYIAYYDSQPDYLKEFLPTPIYS
ncbi:Uncharacterised protein [Yersinia intermedia]|nr:Uncharacterised protein [Yersinia intermedia]